MQTSIPFIVICLLSMLAGCRATSGKGGQWPTYPANLVQDEVLDVQVFRDGTTMRLSNTTTRRIGRSIVWVNKRFGREIQGLDVGESLEVDLRDFVDEFGHPFRAGGFFAAEAPQPLVLVQVQPLEGELRLLGLIVAKGAGE